MKRLLLSFILLGFVFFSPYTWSMELPPRPANAIDDPDHVLSQQENQRLYDAMIAFWNVTHVNPWVCLRNKLTDEDFEALSHQLLDAWRLMERTDPPSRGDVLFLTRREGENRFRTKIVVSDSLKEKFLENELALIADQQVMNVHLVNDTSYFPDFTGALIAIQNTLVSEIHYEDSSPKGSFIKVYHWWLEAPWYQKIIGIFILLFFAIGVPIAFVLGKIRSAGGDSGGGDSGISGGGGDFGGGGGSGKW